MTETQATAAACDAVEQYERLSARERVRILDKYPATYYLCAGIAIGAARPTEAGYVLIVALQTMIQLRLAKETP